MLQIGKTEKKEIKRNIEILNNFIKSGELQNILETLNNRSSVSFHSSFQEELENKLFGNINDINQRHRSNNTEFYNKFLPINSTIKLRMQSFLGANEKKISNNNGIQFRKSIEGLRGSVERENDNKLNLLKEWHTLNDDELKILNVNEIQTGQKQKKYFTIVGDKWDMKRRVKRENWVQSAFPHSQLNNIKCEKLVGSRVNYCWMGGGSSSDSGVVVEGINTVKTLKKKSRKMDQQEELIEMNIRKKKRIAAELKRKEEIQKLKLKKLLDKMNGLQKLLIAKEERKKKALLAKKRKLMIARKKKLARLRMLRARKRKLMKLRAKKRKLARMRRLRARKRKREQMRRLRARQRRMRRLRRLKAKRLRLKRIKARKEARRRKLAEILRKKKMKMRMIQIRKMKNRKLAQRRMKKLKEMERRRLKQLKRKRLAIIKKEKTCYYEEEKNGNNEEKTEALGS